MPSTFIFAHAPRAAFTLLPRLLLLLALGVAWYTVNSTLLLLIHVSLGVTWYNDTLLLLTLPVVFLVLYYFTLRLVSTGSTSTTIHVSLFFFLLSGIFLGLFWDFFPGIFYECDRRWSSSFAHGRMTNITIPIITCFCQGFFVLLRGSFMSGVPDVDGGWFVMLHISTEWPKHNTGSLDCFRRAALLCLLHKC